MTWNLKEFVNQGVELTARIDVLHKTHVAILLGHYNGSAFLAEQLRSLAAQTHKDWSLIVSDDGSTDHWLNIMADFVRTTPDRRVDMMNGPRRGFARNFLSLLTAAGPTVPYVAFCDQDDVWLPDKLARAIAALERVRPGRPALYCGRTTICDRDLRPIGVSPLFAQAPSFANALVQNIGGGNTMVVNRAALDILQDTALHASDIVSHDWWAYQIISGAGGQVFYDPEPSVLYRQHGRNIVGANQSWRARLTRINRLLRGEFRAGNAAHSQALWRARHWLSPEAVQALQRFDQLRNGPLRHRVRVLHRSGIHRQTRCGQAALYVAALLKRI